MSDAFKCDRCNELKEGRAASFFENSGFDELEFDLCGPCKEQLKMWLKNGS